MPEQVPRDNAFRRAARGAFWGGFATISVMLAYQVTQSDDGAERLAQAHAEAVQLAGAFEQLRHGGAGTQLAGTAKKSDLAAEVTVMRNRLAALENQFSTVTGSLQERPPPAYSMLSPVREEARDDPFAAKAGTEAESRVTRTGFALALGAADELDGLQQTWARLKKEFPIELKDLEPQIKLDRRPGGMTLLLLAGTLPNAQDAARLCARIKASGAKCRTVPLTGPTIALNAGQG